MADTDATLEIDEEGASIAEAGEEEKQSGKIGSPAKEKKESFPIFDEDENIKSVEILDNGNFKITRLNEEGIDEIFYVSTSIARYGSVYNIDENGKKDYKLFETYDIEKINLEKHYLKINDKKEIYTPLKKEEINNEKKANVIRNKAMINSFVDFASLFLTEPERYIDGSEKEIEEEIKRIQKELYDLDVVPCFYRFLENECLEYFEISEDIKKTIKNVLLETYIEEGIASVVRAVGRKSSNVEDAFTNSYRMFTNLHEYKNQNYKKKQKDNRNIDHLIEKRKRNSSKSSFIGNNTTIDQFKNHVYEKMFKHQAIRVFLDEISNMRSASKISQLMSNTLKNKVKKIEKEDDVLTSRKKAEEIANLPILFSESLLGKEVDAYLNFCLMFPSKQAFGIDDHGANDVFKLSLNNQNNRYKLKIKGRRPSSDSYKDLYYIAEGDYKIYSERNKDAFNLKLENENNIVLEYYFNNKRNEIIAEQNKKIALLKSIFEALLEDAVYLNYEEIIEKSPEIENIFSDKSVFELLEDSAYPDITLPLQVIKTKENLKANKLPVDFYYYDAHARRENKDKDKKVISNIIRTSLNFKKQISEGYVWGGPSEGIVGKENISTWSMNLVSAGNQIQEKDQTTPIKVGGEQTLENTNVPAEANIPQDLNQDELKRFINIKKEEIKYNLEKAKNLKENFGNKYGFIEIKEEEGAREEKNNSLQEVIKRLSYSNNQLRISDKDLSELSEEAYSNFSSLKGMKGAFPTFRLYIVEEDSIESGKLTAYDDFFSYNSVISFKVHSSREMSASTASIQLQNISGILDGTRKNVKRDTDIDSEIIYNEGDSDDYVNDLIESIVLRPGINVQLRAGYESSTNDLETLISGRVASVNYSSDNMICNIEVQSYGVELDSKILKNLAKDNTNNVFYSTHQLLGNLVLSKELKHFGRVKEGKLFQTGENNQPSLDTEVFSSGSSIDFSLTHSIADFFKENIFAIAIGGMLLGNVGGAILKQATLRSKFLARAANWLAKNKVIKKAIDNIDKATVFKFKGVSGWRRAGSLLMTPAIAGRKMYSVVNNIMKKMSGQMFENNKTFEKLIESGVLTKIDIINLRKAAKAGDKNLLRGILSYRVSSGQITKTAANAIEEALLIEVHGFYSFMNGVSRSSVLRVLRRNEVLRKQIAALNIPVTTTASAAGKLQNIKNFLSGAGNFLAGVGKFALGGNGVYIKTGALGIGLITGLGLIEFLYEEGKNAIGGMVNFVSEWWSGKRDLKRKIMLSPQDDNIFCPNPRSYLKNANLGTFAAVLKFGSRVGYLGAATLEAISFGVSSNFEIFYKNNYDEDIIREKEALFDKRMDASDSLKENVFHLQGMSIWQTLHEASMRHPGWTYGVRPYGNTLEYRIFFGLPNMRYWKKDLSYGAVFRLNKIYQEIDKKFDSSDFLLDENELMFFYRKEIEELKENQNGNLTEKDKIKLSSKLLKEYITKTTERFTPFRKVYHVNSSTNLITNGVIVSEHNIINKVSVHYKNRGDDNSDTSNGTDFKIIEMKANQNIPAQLERPKEVKSPNIIGPANAFRYGMSALLEGMKNLYEGDLLILGNEKIFPQDIVILEDNVSKMYGPLEVKSVTHMFGHDTGFLTNLEVNAITAPGEDSMTYPMIEAAVMARGREKIYNTYASRESYKIDFVNSEDGIFLDSNKRNLIQGVMKEIFSESFESELNLNKEDKKELEDFFLKRLQENIARAEESGVPLFLNDVISNTFTIPEGIISGRLREIFGISAVAAGVGGVGGRLLIDNKISGGLKLVQKSRVGAAAVGILSVAGLIGAGIAEDFVNDSLTEGFIGKNLMRPVIMTNLDNSSLIEVYPLVKEGKPLLAGGLEQIEPSKHFTRVLNNVFTQVSDAYVGFLKKQNEIAGAKEEIEYRLGDDESMSFSEFKIDRVKMNKENSTPGIWDSIGYFLFKDGENE